MRQLSSLGSHIAAEEKLDIRRSFIAGKRGLPSRHTSGPQELLLNYCKWHDSYLAECKHVFGADGTIRMVHGRS